MSLGGGGGGGVSEANSFLEGATKLLKPQGRVFFRTESVRQKGERGVFFRRDSFFFLYSVREG